MVIYYIILIFVFIVVVVTTLFILPVFFSCFWGAPFVPINKKQIKRLEDILKLKGGETVYDLGSGDGRILLELVENLKVDINAIGVERSFVLCLWSRLKVRLKGFGRNIKIKHKNILKEDLSKADVVICYLLPGLMKKLSAKFDKELKPGSIVVSFSFPMHNKKPFLKEKKDGYSLFVYKF